MDVVDRSARRARIAVAVCFFVNAVLYANLVPRYPEVKTSLGLTNASLGAAIAAMPAGALLAGPLAPAFIRRFGSGRVASFGLLGLAVSLAAVAWAGTWAVFAALMLVAGALDGVVDVAQNAHGFRVQRRYRRSIVNAFHGLWSVGAVTGGLIGSAAAGASIPLEVHLGVSAVVFGGAALVISGALLSGPDDAELDTAPSVEPHRLRAIGAAGRHVAVALAALGVLAIADAVIEDAGASWGAVYLRDDLGAAAATAGLAFVALQTAMTLGRLLGDRVVDRFGRRRVAAAGGVLVVSGMGFALAVPSVATTLVGFALAGLGVATLVPGVMHAADELPSLGRGVGLAVVSWLLRIGFLASPPVVGSLADAVTLRFALGVSVVAGAVIVVVSRTLPARQRRPS